MSANQINPDVIQLVSRVFDIVAIAVLAIGVGFGARNIINNFISGWVLMRERPIKINDILEIGDTRGGVESISPRSTRICRVDGVHLLAEIYG